MKTASMDKVFDPASYEGKWQQWWSERGLFAARAGAAEPSYCIMIPPPNVTGALHIGHALQSTIQDLLTRWKRMQGFNALWLPGTDHAGIATQLMVERQLAAEGLDRREIGREAFVERVWEWKHRHHGEIRAQFDKLGASCDWSRERFTLDESLSRAVTAAFVRLHREGLISRGEYMVNWSPALDTALSDLEVEMLEVRGRLYRIAYSVEDGEPIVVATTRPETMLGDTAIAYHPDDDRYRGLAEAHAVLPLVGRRLPFVADEAVDPEFGTGLVKVTPAHDPADFEIGRRHGLDSVQVIDRRGRMTEAAGADFAGLDRDEARRLVVERLRASGALIGEEEYVHNVGHCQRSGVPIEPLLSTQWFCDVSSMAARALAAARDGELQLVPDSWLKTWEHWLANIRPWCISRQLWWGHRIPAWYTPDGRCFVAENRAAAAAAAGTEELRRDDDVLDTWFSSGLWPFSTLGWPEETADLETFYPTDVLVTAFDIIFFWVARMVMFGLHLTDRLPFHTVHLTNLVRDAQGQKMSKTRGNTVDPLDLVDAYGADALRFTLAILETPGRDIALDPDRLAGYRAFGNKIWNATRFVLGRVGEAEVAPELDREGLADAERWILSRLSRTAAEVNERFAEYRFDRACERLYHFFWGDLCDWYIEMSKPVLLGRSERPRVAETLLTVLEASLRLLHPVMPFLTEELWQRLPGHRRVHPESIAVAPFPEARPEWVDEEVERRIGRLQEVVTRVRNLRAELKLPPQARPALYLEAADEELAAYLAEQAPLIVFLAGLSRLEMAPPPESAARDAIAGLRIGLVAAEGDLSATQRERVASELAELGGQIERLEQLLANRQFVDKAPVEVVESNRQKLGDLRRRRDNLAGGLAP
jgi:valyl-tRNA synthetase